MPAPETDPLAVRLLYSPHDPHPPQHAFYLLDELETLEAFYGGAGGGGKMSRMVDMVYTPNGPRAMADLNVGDLVTNPRTGGATRIIAVHDHPAEPAWRVSFDDGGSLIAGAEHLWTVRRSGRLDKSDDRAKRLGLRDPDPWLHGYEVCTTLQLAAFTATADAQALAGRQPLRPHIPVTRPIEFTISYRHPDGVWTVEPYVLGLLLGDGHIGKSIGLTTADPELATTFAAYCATLGDETYETAKPGNQARQVSVRKASRSALRARLDALDLVGKTATTKSIPAAYRRSPLAVRRALMAGLIDSDGYVDARGHISYTSVSSTLADDVAWIARSLGARAHVTRSPAGYRNALDDRVACSDAYTVWIMPEHPEGWARLPRKAARLLAPQHRPHRKVIAVEPEPDPVDMRCITVASPDGLYVTGDDFTVTHNSDALLTAALRYVDVPGYAALILRKTFSDLALPGAIMARAREWLAGTDATWNERDSRFTFPTGATLSFGYLQTAGDRYRYQGAEFQYVAFDELTQFSEVDYRYLFTRLRKPAEGPLAHVPLRMRSASNPGGRGHEWVKRRLVERRTAARNPDEAPDPLDTPERAAARVFIPARLTDNPSVDTDSYTESLAGVDEYTRAQILDGDWHARPPGAWVYDHHHLAAVYALGDELDEELDRGTIPPPAGDLLAIGIDWGEHTHALIGWPLEGGGLYVVAERVSHSGEPDQTTADIIGRAARPRARTGGEQHDDPVAGVLDVVYTLGARPRPANLPPPLPPGRDPLELVSDHRFDAAGIQSMRTYTKAARRRHPNARTTSVPFGAPAPQSGKAAGRRSYKAETIGHLRRLARRAGEGKTTGILAVGRRAPELRRQLQALEWKDREAGIVGKRDDHGPDALIALDAPYAIRHR